MTRALRATGWTLILAGTIVLLYVVYSLLFTGVGTQSAQAEMRDTWGDVPTVDEPTATETPTEAPSDARSEPVDPGDPVVPEPEPAAPATVPEGEAVLVLEFVRPGSPEPLVHADPLFVVEGTSRDALTRGPGHYRSTPLPGQPGNVGIAGHRTTYGSPFFHLDQLGEGDEIHLTDRDGERHVYRFAEQRIVAPSDTSVLAPDPLGTGRSTLTLTTCHPRFSAAERMIVFAELVE